MFSASTIQPDEHEHEQDDLFLKQSPVTIGDIVIGVVVAIVISLVFGWILDKAERLFENIGKE